MAKKRKTKKRLYKTLEKGILKTRDKEVLESNYPKSIYMDIPFGSFHVRDTVSGSDLRKVLARYWFPYEGRWVEKRSTKKALEDFVSGRFDRMGKSYSYKESPIYEWQRRDEVTLLVMSPIYENERENSRFVIVSIDPKKIGAVFGIGTDMVKAWMKGKDTKGWPDLFYEGVSFNVPRKSSDERRLDGLVWFSTGT